jgi:hypothetical protein
MDGRARAISAKRLLSDSTRRLMVFGQQVALVTGNSYLAADREVLFPAVILR